jgi:hypothetical protein
VADGEDEMRAYALTHPDSPYSNRPEPWADDVRVELGECTEGGDHEVVSHPDETPYCTLCGAEFPDD